MPDTNLQTDTLVTPAAGQSSEDQVSDAALLFGTSGNPPLWLWLTIEPGELSALEAALLRHLRSPLFPSRIGEDAVRPGDDAALLDFAARFGAIAARFAEGPALVLAAARIVAERGGPLCRQGALACIETLQYRLHSDARGLGGDSSRLRHFVLAARLSADLWLRFLPGPESARPVTARLAEVLNLPAQTQPPAAAASAPPPPVSSGSQAVVLQPFTPPNDRGEWQSYHPLTTPLPLRRVPRDALARLGALAEAAPSFAAPLAEIRRTLALAAHAGRPSPRLRPILLVGPPGVGKTWFARRLAAALDLPFASLNLGGATDNRCLQGTARGWSATTPAWPIAEMARLSAPNPVFFLDEIEKAGGQRDTNGRAHDTLLAMIEPESAGAWFDECLRTMADLRHAIWIMAANETRGISAPLLSRLSVHHIEPPPASAFDGTYAGLLAGIAEDMGCTATDLPPLEPEARAALRRGFAGHRNLRRLRAQMEECLGIAAEAVLSAPRC
ncbi:AAA family ATPase [Belnapia rosea]|uniref:AAA family ATPase n=1 Tax=Belnapia rosea TaxID=938405 RepID=UPI00088E4325|nr:AAA family ATPase [Belnapia rosea]SDB67166.1 ATPase family associated with various cellular activities (AAA) [Belnapia rosea]